MGPEAACWNLAASTARAWPGWVQDTPMLAPPQISRELSEVGWHLYTTSIYFLQQQPVCGREVVFNVSVATAADLMPGQGSYSVTPKDAGEVRMEQDCLPWHSSSTVRSASLHT